MAEPRRYYVRSPDGRMIFGLDDAAARDEGGTSALDLAEQLENRELIDLLQAWRQRRG
jgi:hypothetical protein